MAVKIDSTLCPQNHRCPLIDSCPVGAISQNGFELPVFDDELCIDCGKCVERCGMKALVLDK